MTCTTVIDYIDIAYSDINVYKMKSIQSFLLLLMQFMAAGQTSKILILQSFNQDTCVYFTLICNKQKNMNGCHQAGSPVRQSIPPCTHHHDAHTGYAIRNMLPPGFWYCPCCSRFASSSTAYLEHIQRHKLALHNSINPTLDSINVIYWTYHCCSLGVITVIILSCPTTKHVHSVCLSPSSPFVKAS